MDVSFQSHSTAIAASKPTSGEGTGNRVRGVIYDSVRKRVLVQVNNRVDFGSLTMMLPGGGLEQGEGDLTALARELKEELGLTIQLAANNCRFIQSRSYEFPNNPDGSVSNVRINFYAVDIGDSVPRNMEQDSVISVSWLTLTDIQRYLDLDNSNWRIQLGAFDAIDAVLNPAKSKLTIGVGDSAREVGRQDGGKPSGDTAEDRSRVTKLPYM